jgi:hypothetical protein
MVKDHGLLPFDGEQPDFLVPPSSSSECRPTAFRPVDLEVAVPSSARRTLLPNLSLAAALASACIIRAAIGTIVLRCTDRNRRRTHEARCQDAGPDA